MVKRSSAGEQETGVHLREHVYEINTADRYYDVIRRLRHARYALDSLLASARLYGDAEVVDPLRVEAREIRRRFDELEMRPATRREDGRLVRDEPSLDEDEFEQLTISQVQLWQDAELILARVYEAMAASLEKRLVTPGRETSELHILVSIVQFHSSRRMDNAPPCRTYIFDLGLKDRFEMSFFDSEPRRRRAETWYDQALHAIAASYDVSRKQRESQRLVQLTWVITVLTVLIAILTTATLWSTFASR